MPLTTRNFNQIGGLNTNRNILDRNPSTMADTRNAVFTRPGSADSRKGHPIYWSPTSSETDLKTGDILGLVEHPVDADTYIITHEKISTSLGQFSLLSSSNTVTSDIAKMVVTGAEAVATGHYAPSVEWSSSTDYVGWVTSRHVNAQQNQYIMTANGMFRNLQGSANNKFKKVVPATINKLVLDESSSATDDDKWLLPGYKVIVIALVREQISETGFLEWIPSGEVEFVNYSGTAVAIDADIDAQVANILDLEDGSIEVYRTLQFRPTEPRPIQFFLCDTFPLSRMPSSA